MGVTGVVSFFLCHFEDGFFLQHLTFAWGNCRTTTVLAWRSQPYFLLSPHRLLLLSFLNSPAAVCLCVNTSPSVCLSRGDRRGSLGSQDYIHKTNDGDCLLLFGLLASCWKNKRPLYTFPPCVAAPLVSHLVEKGPLFLLNLIALRSWRKTEIMKRDPTFSNRYIYCNYRWSIPASNFVTKTETVIFQFRYYIICVRVSSVQTLKV